MTRGPSRDYRPWLILPLGLAVGMSTAFIPARVAHATMTLAGDYGRYVTAAHFLLQGRNPYNQLALVRAEQAYTHLSVVHAAATSDGFVLLPFVMWPVLLLVNLPFWSSYVVVVVFATVSFGGSVSLIARALGWRRPWLAAALACVAWIFVWGRLIGQLDFILPVSLVATCFLLARKHNYLAGLALTGIWVEPELTWMAGVALIVMLLSDHRALKQALIGFVGASAVLFGISALVPHGILLDWARGGFIFLHREGSHEYDLLGLPGLIQVLDPSNYRLYAVTAVPTVVIAALGVVTAVGSAVWMRGSKAIAGMPVVEATLWRIFLPVGIWLLFTPYGHPNNAIILIPLVVLAIGADAIRIAGSAVDVVLLCVIITLAQFFSGTVLFADLMPVATALVLVLVYRQLRKMEAAALASLHVGVGGAQTHLAG